jgi:hypothetical protein
MNNEPKSTGRTVGDTVVEVLGNWKLISIAFATLLIAFLAVISDAEPGTTVEVFGIKYQRAKPKAPVLSPTPDPADGYLYYSKKPLTAKQNDALPILDGSLALEPRIYYPSSFGDSKPQAPYLNGASLLGPNIQSVRIAARRHDGRAASLYRPVEGGERVDFDREAYVEIEYKGSFFSLQTELSLSRSLPMPQDELILVTLKRISRPTLELSSFEKIAPPKPSSD